jgi:hypothetical protein
VLGIIICCVGRGEKKNNVHQTQLLLVVVSMAVCTRDICVAAKNADIFSFVSCSYFINYVQNCSICGACDLNVKILTT